MSFAFTCLIVPTFSCSISTTILLCKTCSSEKTAAKLLTGPNGNRAWAELKISFHSRFVFSDILAVICSEEMKIYFFNWDSL